VGMVETANAQQNTLELEKELERMKSSEIDRSYRSPTY
jgi:hypothetical protein